MQDTKIIDASARGFTAFQWNSSTNCVHSMDQKWGAVLAGVLALPNIFGVNKAMLTSKEFLIGSIGEAKIGAQFSKEGNTLVADVLGLYGAREQGLGTTTRTLLKSILGFAKEEGLKEVRISGVALINKDLEKRLIKNGWTLTEVKVGNETATAYTKTFAVK